MSRRIILINIGVFIFLLSLVEVVCQIDDRLHFLPPVPVRAPDNPNTRDHNLALQELGPGVLRPVPPQYQYRPDPALANLAQEDSKTVFLTKPNPDQKYGEFRVQKRTSKSNAVIYDVNYHTEYGRRAVENQNKKTKTKNFVFAYGCSLTMGEGVNQGLDYPSQLAEKLDRTWKVYNFGYFGYGPNGALRDLKDRPYKFKNIPEEKGIFVWFLIWDHPMRLLCPWYCYKRELSWMMEKPEAVIENGKFEIKKSIRESSNLKRQFFYLLSRSSAVQHLGFSSSANFSVEDHELFTKSFDQIEDELKVHGKTITKKYVVIFTRPSGYAKLKEILLAHNYEPIEYFRLAELVSLKNPYLALDTHPSSETYWYVSEVLKYRIEQDFPRKK